MGFVAWSVEHFYPMLVPIVVLASAYVIVVKGQQSLVFPFIIGLFVMAVVFYLTHLWPIFSRLISSGS
jgi:hypothetical protein